MSFSLRTTIASAVLFAAGSAALAADDLVIADFEGPDYAGWTVAGEAFGVSPAHGALAGQMEVSGFAGQGLANSYVGGDASTGRLVSTPFAIERPFINFLIGGGEHPGETCINLRIGDQIVRTTTGPNGVPGGSERLEWSGWDVGELRGQTAVIEILDASTGGWGHINIDQIVQSDVSLRPEPLERVLLVDHRYLLCPVRTGAPKCRLQVLHHQKVIKDFEIELASERPDFWVSCDLTPWKGASVVIRAGRPSEAAPALQRLRLSDELPDVEDEGPLDRPQIHFTARRGWLNDPNGLVYLDGEWHLYFQHNPYGWNWGNMHWGHAISRDLLHWRRQPIAMAPREFGDWAFSGSAVVDAENTSGWMKAGQPVLVAAFTSTGRGECIVYSTDRGLTWTEFEGNPVVKHSGRDPRLLWHAASRQWVMAVYDETDGKQWIAFYSSPDLQHWTLNSRIEGFFECPDLFELPIAGQVGTSRWVLYAANGEYMLGEFDGREFTRQSGKHRLWYGNFYAAQTFSNAPDGRRVQIGWGQGIEFPGRPFNQQMTIPVELTLHAYGDELRMTAMPVRELRQAETQNLRHEVPAFSGVVESPSVASLPADVELRCTNPKSGALRLELWGEPVTIDFEARTATVCDVPAAPWSLAGQEFTLRAVLDTGSLEVFIGDGRTAISARARPHGDAPRLVLIRDGEPLAVELHDYWSLAAPARAGTDSQFR